MHCPAFTAKMSNYWALPMCTTGFKIHSHRSAPVPGRSNTRQFSSLRIFQVDQPVVSYCARGQARSAASPKERRSVATVWHHCARETSFD
jgi:hypothetical protein